MGVRWGEEGVRRGGKGVKVWGGEGRGEGRGEDGRGEDGRGKRGQRGGVKGIPTGTRIRNHLGLGYGGPAPTSIRLWVGPTF